MASVVLLLVCSAAEIAWPETIEQELRYGVNYWREAEGLPQSRIRAIVQTRDGYLWLGTDNGVVRFNGASFTAFTVETGNLKDNEVWSLTEDDAGGLWIGTYGGGLTLLRDGKFTTFTSADGLPDELVTQLDKDAEGNIWIGTPGGVSRFADGVFTHFSTADGLPDNHLNAICARSPLGIQVASGNKLLRFQNGRFDEVKDLADEKDDAIEHLLSGRDGSLWLSFSNAVIKRWKGGAVTTYTRRNNLTPHISAISEDAQGNFWAVLENGLNKLADGKFSPVALESGAEPTGTIYSLFADQEGNMWLGLQANGLGRIRIKELSTIAAADGLSDESTRAVFEDSRGTLWIGTSSGFAVYRDGAISNYEEFEGWRLDSVRSFAEDIDGNVWISSGKTLLLMKNGRLARVSAWNGRFEVKVLYKDAQNRLWIGTDGDGLFRYDNGNFVNYRTSDGLAGNNLRAILDDGRGALWIATSGGGVSRFADGKFTNYTTREGLAGNRVMGIYADDEGTLWFTTREGLSRYADGKFFNYSATSGLLVGFIYAILDDGKGNFWFSSAKGLFRAGRAELREFAEGRRQKIVSVEYGVRDGLQTRAFNLGNQPAVWKTRGGLLLFCSLKGLVIVDPARISASNFVPPVYIEEAIVNRENQALKGKTQIPAGSGEFEIHFAALSYQSPEKLRFQYKLEGYDEDWIDAGARRFAYYANLAPGEYRFRVKAGNVGGAWNEDGASYSFYLQPHFYQTRLFWGLVVTMVILLAVLLYRLRMMDLKARYSAVLTERNRIALEIHDTLAQNLAGIALQLDSITMQLADMPDKLRRSVDQACNLTRYSLSEARRAVSDLRSDELKNHELPVILPEIAGRIAANSGIRTDIRITGAYRKLSPATEKNLLRIFQEAVANAVKHSRASSIRIELRYGIDRLLLSVIDNGQGFDTNNLTPLSIGHYGIIGMRERAERFGGRLTLKSSPGKGTELNVELTYATQTETRHNMRLEQ